MKVLSLGWGVQSFTLAAMVALGELEPIDYAIHADTTHESQLTYEFAKRWTPWLEERGVKVITVINPTGGIWEIFKRLGQTHIPAYTKATNAAVKLVKEVDYSWDENGDEIEIETGRMIEVIPNSDGQLNRSCTHRWKIVPMRRWLQLNRNGLPVEQWIGISLDEFQRMKDSDVKYITNRWPLIEKKMTRRDCENWLKSHGIEVPPKSACTFCPYHNTAEWRRIKTNSYDWKETTEVDNALRKVRPPYDLFVHPSRKPLEEVDFRTEQEKGQLSLWDQECTGLCGV